MTGTKNLTFAERATWGACPECGAPDGEWCGAQGDHGEDSFGYVFEGYRVRYGENTHRARLAASPRRVRLVPVADNDAEEK